MPSELQPDLSLGDAMMQMNDGIHPTFNYMHVVGLSVKTESLKDRRSGFEQGLKLITREDFIEHLEDIGAGDSAFEKCYGEFNTFAIAVDRENEYFAWYNNDR